MPTTLNTPEKTSAVLHGVLIVPDNLPITFRHRSFCHAYLFEYMVFKILQIANVLRLYLVQYAVSGIEGVLKPWNHILC